MEALVLVVLLRPPGEAHHNHDDDEGEDEDAGDADQRQDPLQHLVIVQHREVVSGGRLRGDGPLFSIHHLYVAAKKEHDQLQIEDKILHREGNAFLNKVMRRVFRSRLYPSRLKVGS